ncbi:putative DNA primase [Pseudomonas phage Ep4]|uniref:DNA primase n=1 Tax=Pseudomonas phage Ep4 TaxID=3057492 RepID=A0AAU9E8H4_9CAUD|nr:putative DNA primase [Pseudomonas phage Ep4]
MADFLPREDWLKQAQSIAVGRKQRVRHGFETSAAMDVYNNEDSWSAYCHRCHVGARVMKEHQSVRRVVVEPNRIAPVPTTVIPVNQASPYEQRQIWDLLIRKGCPPQVIPEEMLWYDRTVRRVLLRSGPLALGRALDPNRTPKWLPYGEWQGLPMVWTTRQPASGTLRAPGVKPGWVVAEDALSAHKISKAIETYYPRANLGVVATLGTRVTDRLVPYLSGCDVACMYDGDSAGLDGFTHMRQRMRVFGGTVYDARPTTGDPKNMTLQHAAERLLEVYGVTRLSGG